MSDARLVTGEAASSAATSINARAFTVGNRVFFGGGHDPTSDGGNLLAHELTHVSQQRGAAVPGSWNDLPFVPHDDSRERAARCYDAGVGMFGGTGMAIARDSEGDTHDPNALDAKDFAEQLAGFDNVLQDIFINHNVVPNGPYGELLNGFFTPRLPQAIAAASKGQTAVLASLLAPESLSHIVDRARALNWEQKDEDSVAVKTNKGPNNVLYNSSVLIEITNGLIRRYLDSVARMVPRVVSAVRARKPEDGAVDPSSVLASHPMDRLLAPLLVDELTKDKVERAVASGAVTVATPDARITEYVPITFPPRLWHWVSAPPCSKEQLAASLFGRSEEAYRLIPLPPLWGFAAEDIKAFTPEHRAAYASAVSRALLSFVRLEPGSSPPADVLAACGLSSPTQPTRRVDPVEELIEARSSIVTDRIGENVAAAQPAEPGSVGVVDLISALTAIIGNLEDISKLVPLFKIGVDTVASALTTQLARREEARRSAPTDLDKRYGLADAQRDLVDRIATGVGDASARFVQAGGERCPSEATREVLNDIIEAFVATVVALDLPELATVRLEHAEELVQNVEISLQEATLHERLSELQSEEEIRVKDGGAGIDVIKQAKQFGDYQLKLLDARMAMRRNPGDTLVKVQAQRQGVDNLAFEIGISEKLRRLDALWGAIKDMEGFWEWESDRDEGRKLQGEDRALYARFRAEVFKPFMDGDAEHDDGKKTAARTAYSTLLQEGGAFDLHAREVVKFLKKTAKHERWTKFVVGLAIAFVAFGLGQFEFGAMIAAEASVAEAAVAAGLVTTVTSATLNKIILDQDPSLIGVVTGFVFNAGTFFVIGKLALAARAAGAEAAFAEGAETAVQGGKGAAPAATATAEAGGVAAKGITAAKVGNYAVGLAKETLIAEAMGTAQSEIEKVLSDGRTLSWSELGDLWGQQLLGVIGMRVANHGLGPDFFQYKGPEHALAKQIDALATFKQQVHDEAIQLHEDAASRPLGKPDVPRMNALLKKWGEYLERDKALREKVLELAEKRPAKFKPEDIAALKASRPDPALIRQVREARAVLSVEPAGINKFTCAPGSFEIVVHQHEAAGSEILEIETDPDTGQRGVRIKPETGPEILITEKLQPKGQRTAATFTPATARHFEAWLRKREASNFFRRRDGYKVLLKLYASDQLAAMRLAESEFGYEPSAQTDSSAIGQEAAASKDPKQKVAIDPSLPIDQKVLAAKLGNGVYAIGEGRFRMSPTELKTMHDARVAEGKASELHYDPETQTTSFELESEGKRLRIEAQLSARINSFAEIRGAKHQVVGEPIPGATGEAIMRSIAGGDYSALSKTGIAGEVVLPGKEVEFGLGKIGEDTYVVVIGEPSSVDWAHLPGIEPEAHTHPLHAGNDLFGEKGRSETAVVLIEDLISPRIGRDSNRNLVFPSTEDFVMMALRRVAGHRVFTGFVVTKRGGIRKPVAGDASPRLELTIGKGELIGSLQGKRVFESTIEGTAGAETVISERKIWIVEDSPGGSGDLFMDRPDGVVAADSSQGRPAPGEGTKTRSSDPRTEWANDTLPAHDVPGMMSLPPTTIDMLMTVSAVDARDLVHLATKELVETALGLGPSGPITAKHLVALSKGVPQAVFVDMLRSAKVMKGRLLRLARIADNIDAAQARLGQESLDKESLILDSNVQIGIDNLIRGKDLYGKPRETLEQLEASHRDGIEAIRSIRKLGPYVPPVGRRPTVEDIVGAGTDLRSTVVSGAEVVFGEGLEKDGKRIGTPSDVLPETPGNGPRARGVKVRNQDPDYARVIADLGRRDVGDSKGAVDRSVVADAIFAESSSPVRSLVCADRDVLIPLARAAVSPRNFQPAGVAKEHYRELVARFPEGHFTIELLGQFRLTVYFAAPTGKPPVPP